MEFSVESLEDGSYKYQHISDKLYTTDKKDEQRLNVAAGIQTVLPFMIMYQKKTEDSMTDTVTDSTNDSVKNSNAVTPKTGDNNNIYIYG